MKNNKLRYSDFSERINMDAFEEAIGWTPDEDLARGDNDVGYCVWPENHSHGDTTGKFAIHREKRVYNCYVCGGGSLLSLVMELKDLDVDEATDWLYQFTEEDMRSDADFVEEFLAAFEDVKKRTATLPFFNDRVLDRFSDPIGEAVEWDDFLGEYVNFWEKRNIDPERVGGPPWNVRFSWDIHRPTIRNPKFEGQPDYIGPGLVFPHYWQDRLVGWQTRWLEREDVRPTWVPKYTMTTDFPKDSTVFNYKACQWHAERGGPVVVLESVTSTLALETAGMAAVATFGSNVNEAQIRLLRRFPVLILGHDNDTAGIKWRDSLTEALKDYSTIYHLPPYAAKPKGDLGDIAALGWDELVTHLDKAYEPGIDTVPDTNT